MAKNYSKSTYGVKVANELASCTHSGNGGRVRWQWLHCKKNTMRDNIIYWLLFVQCAANNKRGLNIKC